PTSQQQQTHQIQVELFHLKKSIIENCLFGVDINPNSCEITKLRLWIELLKYSYYLFDDQGENTNALETLPNIDINIKCGNSLISYFDLKQSLTHYPNIKSRIQNYKQMVSDYKKGLFDDKTKLSTQIQELFSAFKSFCFKDKFAKEIKAFQNKCDTYRKLYGNYLAKDDKELSLFITQNPFPKYDLTFEGDEKILQEANQSFLEIRKTYDSLYNLSSNNPFEWRFAFPEVLDSEGNFLGFDCVIGNPPYIRIQGLDRATSKQYQKTFSTASQNYDIYVLFVEQCVKLLAPKAKIAFIMPHKWLNSLFGVGLRELAKDKISKIISFGHYQIFDASTYTALQWFEKESREVKFIQAPQEIESSQEMSEFLTQLTPSDFFIFPTNSLSSSPWYFGGDLSQNLFSKVTSHTPLKEIFSKMFQGIATSKDSVYFLYDCQEGETTTKGYSQELECNVEIENDLLKPLLMGDSFHRYDTPSTELRVLFPYYQGEDSKGNAKMYLYDESTLKERFPKGYTYLKKCEKVLRARENGRLQDDDMWWRYIYPKNQLLFDKEKLLIPYACRKSQFILDTQGRFYINTKIHGLIRNESFENLDYRFLLAVLNSELNWWYMTQVASVMRGGYYTYTPAYMQDFSIPNLSPKEQKPFIKLVDQILKAKEQNPKANTQDLEKEIDSLVYTLYNLTEDEIKIIENRGWL
ncbi:type II restriction endonuclease, partial [Helicobacter anseris]